MILNYNNGGADQDNGSTANAHWWNVLLFIGTTIKFLIKQIIQKMMSVEGIPETTVIFRHQGKELRIPMTSIPALDMSFTIPDGKILKVCDVKKTKDGYTCICNEVDAEGKILKKGAD